MTTDKNDPETIEDTDLEQASGGPIWGPYLTGRHLPPTHRSSHEIVSESAAVAQEGTLVVSNSKNATG